MTTQASTDAAQATARPRAVRMFGRFQLLQLLGKSERTMGWRVDDPRSRQEWVLLLPRRQPPDALSLDHWRAGIAKASRLKHPNLAAVVETGIVDGWPYVAYDPRDAATLTERIGHQGLPGSEVAQWASQALEGLAYAHEAGVAHHDIQAWQLLLSDNGQPRLMGLEVALDGETLTGQRGSTALDANALSAQRHAAEQDVLAFGLLLHHALAGAPALDEPDVALVIRQMPPLGREIIRLPWALVQPVADPLRAIVNRATDRQERHRYRNARTLLQALQGWLKTDAEAGGGPLALLLDRLHTVGLLPASPGAAERAARMALMERERTAELAEVVLQDIALSFELLRAVNTAQVRGAQVAGSGPVLTVRRAIAMLGLDGVRRAAMSLRPWPGAAGDEHQPALAQAMLRARRAAIVAQALRPAGYDAEVVYLVTMLQNLGRLAVQYHFPDEAAQVRRLMQSAPSEREGEPEEPGMTEEAASFAVLGTDIEALGVAVARHWGLDASVLHIVRRLPASAPVRAGDNDDDVLRAVASCANELIDLQSEPADRQPAGLQRVAQRYARALGVTQRDLQAAMTARAGDNRRATHAGPSPAQDPESQGAV